MSKLKKWNGDIRYDERDADEFLATADTAIQLIVNESQRMDCDNSAASDANSERKMRDTKELSEESRLLASMNRSLDEAGHTKATFAALKRRIAAQEAKVERIKRRIAESREFKIPHTDRMDTARMMKVCEKAGKRPHKLVTVKIPARYSKLDHVAALDLVRQDIGALYEREKALYDAYLTKDEAMARLLAPIKARAERAKSIRLGEAARVREGMDGRFKLESIEIPEAALWDAIVPLAVAHFGDKVDRLYEKIEFEGEEIISLRDRQREQRELEAKCKELELIEGALIRRAVKDGVYPIVRVEMDERNLIPLEIDPDAEWEEPKSAIFEIGRDASANFATKAN